MEDGLYRIEIGFQRDFLRARSKKQRRVCPAAVHCIFILEWIFYRSAFTQVRMCAHLLPELQSGCWPSWASHLHSVMAISVKTAVKLESSGLQA